MADFVKTITNSINLFGIEGSNKWGTLLWGQKWGSGNSDLVVIFQKVVSNSVALSDVTSTQARFVKTISNTFVVSGNMTFEGISDQAGYNLVFGNSTNAENRPLSSYTSYSVYDATFTTATNTSTTWTVV